jgi:hypothetical protein
MLAAIHLNDEASLKADKIHDVSSDRRLPLKFHSLGAMRTKEIPKPSLGLGHVGAKSFGLT